MRGVHVVSGTFWLGLYLVLALAPLGLVLFGAPQAARSFWTELSVALGFVGLAMMCLQFVLTARFEWLKAPYGSDVIYTFHRWISLVSIALVLLHPAILLVERFDWLIRRPVTAPLAFWTGFSSVACLVILAGISLQRKRLGISYDAWRRGHAILAIAALALAVVHVLAIDYYLSTPMQKSLWLGYTLLWVLLIIYVRLVKPLIELNTPWEVVEVKPQRGSSYTLRIRPVGHAGLAFKPGQFAWITMFDSPFTDHEHPFSMSGSAARRDELEFTIKNVGDWTSRVQEAKPGERVYVDGPFGALSADRHPDADGYVFIAGGIGITPMISHLRTFADRGEKRPCVLFYANNTWDNVTYREELDELSTRLNLKIVHVLAKPHEGWTGERGFLTREVLGRHAPSGGRYEYFICGPTPMMRAAEQALADLGVPLGDYHSEEFNLA
jgi:predicted ferric reductase